MKFFCQKTLMGALLLFAFPRCNEEIVLQPNLTGDVIGVINLLPHKTSNQQMVYGDFRDVEVALWDDISILFSTTTNEYGFYKLVGVPTGTYNLLIHKSGYDSIDFQLQHFGGTPTTLGKMYLTKLP